MWRPIAGHEWLPHFGLCIKIWKFCQFCPWSTQFWQRPYQIRLMFKHGSPKDCVSLLCCSERSQIYSWNANAIMHHSALNLTHTLSPPFRFTEMKYGFAEWFRVLIHAISVHPRYCPTCRLVSSDQSPRCQHRPPWGRRIQVGHKKRVLMASQSCPFTEPKRGYCW